MRTNTQDEDALLARRQPVRATCESFRNAKTSKSKSESMNYATGRSKSLYRKELRAAKKQKSELSPVGRKNKTEVCVKIRDLLQKTSHIPKSGSTAAKNNAPQFHLRSDEPNCLA